MKHTKQNKSYDCGLACVACVTEESLDYVTKLAGDSLATREGCGPELLWILLSYLGVATRVLYRSNCDTWPPDTKKPFIARVFTPAQHWIVIDGETAYDSEHDEPSKSDSYEIGNVILELYTQR